MKQENMIGSYEDSDEPDPEEIKNDVLKEF